jgi:hypothetical protein
MATLPPPDVAMDISSPSHRVDQDDDIEIDISDYPIAFELTDDEQMVDGELARPDTATDENMDDDEPINIIPEEVMTDEPQLDNTNTGNDFDDELIDYDDDQAHQNLAVMTFPDSSQTVVPNNAEAFSQVPPHESIPVPDIAPAIQRVDDNLTSITTGLSDAVVAPVVTQDSASLEHAAPSHPSAEHDKTIPVPVVDVHENKSTVVVGESVAGVGEAGRPAVSPAVADKEVTLAQQQQPTEDEAAAQDQQAEADETEAQRQQQHLGKDDASAQQQQQFDRIEELAEQQQSAEDDNPQPSSQKLSESAAEAGVSATDVLPSPTDTGLHPIMVKYRSTEFPLFKSRMALNGLLENDNIVNVSLSELMATCREQLGINTGEKISDDQELCLKIDHMRSSLREHEPRAFEFSLQDVLDTFVLLHQNDGTKDMPAMWLTIELTWNFSKLLKDMRTAAADGYGMSNFEYVNSANDDYYQNDEPDEVEHDHTSVDNEYYEPDEEYADEFEEDEVADRVVDSQNQDHSESQPHDTREDGASIGDGFGTGENEVGQSTSDTIADESSGPQEGDGEPTKHSLAEPDADDGSTNDQKPRNAITNPAVQVDTEGSPAASAVTRAASTGDANDSAYEASNTEVKSTNHEKHVSSRDTVEEAQSDNEFDDAAEVYDAIGDGDLTADEIDESGDFDQQQEASFDHDRGEEFADDIDTVHAEESGKDNTLHADLRADDAEHEDLSVTAEISTVPEPEQVEKPADESAAANDDLIEYDDEEEAALLETSDEQAANEGSGVASDSAGADATLEPEVPSQSENPVPKHQSPRGKRRLEDDSDFDFIDFADDEPDVKKARAG